ncbi:MAG: hypothetical protein P1U56_07445 [Saprospiraceae bacterium]|nr:hypothetical protein [Saprospiraceae bacterium]
MKYSILYSVLILFVFLNCNESKKSTSIKNLNSSTTTIDSTIVPDCFASSKIFHQTAYLWQQSWLSYQHEFNNDSILSSPQLNFDEDLLNSMYQYVSDSLFPGVIIWYVMLSESDPYPSLAIQNTVSCSIDTRSPILLSTYNSDSTSIITQRTLNIYKENWKEKGEETGSVYTPVYGYNYSWNSLNTLMSQNTIRSGIFISYGLRTIEPGEEGNYDSSDTPRSGSVVYCNVLYESEHEKNPLTTLLDFAMPCPEYCGDNKN